MKNTFTATLVAITLCSASLLTAQHSKPATNAATPNAVTPEKSIQAELKSILDRIKAKADKDSGKPTIYSPDKYADELKALDALLAKHAGETNDDVAMVLYKKGTVHLLYLGDKATHEKIVQQLKTDYRGTAIVNYLERQEAERKQIAKIQTATVPGKDFPDFDVKDLDGNPLSVGKFKGKVVLIDFWATWCGPCVAELPAVTELYKKHHTNGLEIIGVTLDSDRKQLDSFRKKHPDMVWPQYYDGKGWDNQLAVKYAVTGVPLTILIGTDGKIIAKNLRGKELADAIEKAISK